MPARRLLLTIAAVLALATGCASTVAGAGSPDPGILSPQPTTPPAAIAYNGVASMSGDDALGSAYYALQHARSVRMKAKFVDWTLELRYTGTDSDGAYVVDGMTVRLRKVGRSVYRKATQDYWRRMLGPAADQLPADKWIKVPITERTVKDLAELLRLDQMATAVLGVSGTLSTGVFKTVHGVETVPVVSDGPDKETVYVALVGEPYPVRLETGTDVASIDFLEYGRRVTIAAPPADQVASFERLPGT